MNNAFLVMGWISAHTSLPNLSGNGYFVIFQPGYYLLLERRDNQNQPIGWKLQSDCFDSESEAIKAFEQECKQTAAISDI